MSRPAPRALRPVPIFLALVFAAVIAVCAPALLGLADADYLGILTPFAQWLPAVAVLAALRLAGRRDRLRTAWRGWPIGGTATWRAIALVTLAVLAVPVLQFTVGVAIGVIDWAPTPDALATAAWILPVALVALLTAAGEEFGWRGFLWTELRGRRGLWATALAIGLIWSAWHLPLLLAYGIQGDVPWRNVVATSIDLVAASVVLGLGRELSNSAWPAACGHALLNSALVFAASNLVTPDAALTDGEFWTFRALGWAAWLAVAAVLTGIAVRAGWAVAVTPATGRRTARTRPRC